MFLALKKKFSKGINNCDNKLYHYYYKNMNFNPKGSSFYNKVVITEYISRLCWQPLVLLARPLSIIGKVCLYQNQTFTNRIKVFYFFLRLGGLLIRKVENRRMIQNYKLDLRRKLWSSQY